MKEIPQHVSESTRKLNPHLYGVGGLETQKPKQATARSLVGADEKCKGGKEGVAFVVTMVSHRKRSLDDDNHTGSLKPLRDAISNSLGIDDGDRRIKWQYHQLKTEGREGVVVTIERLC